MNMPSAADRRIIEQLKKESLEKYHVYSNGAYRIRHLDHQNDDLVYIEGDKALIVGVEWCEPKNYLFNIILTFFRLVKIVIHASEMKVWDNGEELTEGDMKRVTSRISDFIFEIFKTKPIVI
jgi:hypothetical protein